MTSSDDILRIARSHLGVRFAHQGRHPEDGLDCLGFLLAVAQGAGLALDERPAAHFDRRDYGARPDTEFLQARLETLLVREEEIRVADVLLLRVRGRAQHLALVTDHPQDRFGIIHAYAPARKVVEHRLDEGWRSEIAGIYRLPPLAD